MIGRVPKYWLCFIIALSTLGSCEDSESPLQSSPHAPPDSFRLPVFVNEWTAVELPNGNLVFPGTSTVTPEGTILTGAYGFHEYDTEGNKVGIWHIVLDGDTLGAVHIRFRYGKYYTFAYGVSVGRRMLVYDANRRLLRDTPAIPTGPGSVPFASHDVDLMGNVYQLGFDEELVIKYDRHGAFERQWHTHGTNPTGHNWPGGIVVSPRGKVYVSDTLHDRILVFDPRGRLLEEWGSRGDGPGQFRLPEALDSDQWGFLYVVDRSNRRVQKLAPDGTYLGEFPSVVPVVDSDTTPHGIAVGDNDVFVIHSTANLIRRFTFVDD